jgi:hypothetical protein
VPQPQNKIIGKRASDELTNGRVGGASGDKAILISTIIGVAAIVGAFWLALDINAF